MRGVADECSAAGARRIAVDGVDGAGKSFFADELARAMKASGQQVIRISADDFLNARSVRHRRGRRSPEGFFLDSYDYDAFRRFVLAPLRPGGDRRYRARVFDHRNDQAHPAEDRVAAPEAVLIADGLFLHRDELREEWDYSVYLHVDFAVSLARCAARDRDWASAEVESPSNRRYVEGQRLYIDRCSPQQRATRVIDNNDLARPRLVR